MNVMNADKQIERLIDGGEWASSWGEPTGLRDVCRELTEIKGLTQAAERAQAIVDLLDQDEIAAAFARWAELNTLLRTAEDQVPPLRSATGASRRYGRAGRARS